MKDGFYTALGTPLDEYGDFIPGSFKKQVEDQIAAGASGLLVMGSMGIEPCIKNTEYIKIVKAAVEAARGACPVLVGVMDNSVSNVMQRIDCLKGLKIDGIVTTAPYYFTATQDDIKNFCGKIASVSPFPLFLYDLPGVTKVKMSISTIEFLKSVGNVKGIKTGDIVTARTLLRSSTEKDDFDIIYSGLDTFDVAYKYGIRMNLDGMFSCTPSITSRMYNCLEKGSYEEAADILDSILQLRDTFVGVGVFRGFTYAMNLLGYEGIFGPDYNFEINEEQIEVVKECMKKCRLI